MSAHGIPVSVFSFLELSKWWGQIENADVWIPRISWILFSDFYKSDFLFSPIVKYENLDYKKIRNFQISFRY